MPELVLQVNDIDDVGRDYSFPLSVDWLRAALEGTPLGADPAGGPGMLQVHVQRNGREILVDGDLSADLLVECGRCLEPTALPVHTHVTALLSQALGEALPRELELDVEDLDRAEFSGAELVLDELVREHLVLECPMQPLCSEDCPGIEIPAHIRPRPEDFPGPSAIDPRLAPLQALKDRLGGDDKE